MSGELRRSVSAPARCSPSRSSRQRRSSEWLKRSTVARPLAELLRLQARHAADGRSRYFAERISRTAQRAGAPPYPRHGGRKPEPHVGWSASAARVIRRTRDQPEKLVEDEAPATAEASPRGCGRAAASSASRAAGNSPRALLPRRQSALRPEDPSSRRRRHGGRPRRFGRRDRRRRIGARLWRVAGPGHRGRRRRARRAHLLSRSPGRTSLHRRRLCHVPKTWIRKLEGRSVEAQPRRRPDQDTSSE